MILVGSQVAHGIAYWWAYPVASLRIAVLQHTGHGYESYAPLVLGFLAALELLMLVAVVADALTGIPARRLPPWLFLWLPMVAFTLQEHLERWWVGGVFPWWTVHEPSFWRGLVLQVPLGLLAYLIARLLQGTAIAVASAISARRGRSARSTERPAVSRRLLPVFLPRSAPLALAAAGRAPPPGR